ncbi:nucleotide-binding protein [Azospirillum sp.]|uniref:nucleotide-binding protein n=1 Tax=Azospirillum sp. TaxID=34012 RepID=UPI002D27C38A|nr:nucleotide-binding protein [Azospirillum sp.]HYD69359.1 nucleotide-binding protein [Azospirillum sp.]
MAASFEGGIEDLKDKVASAAIVGEWSDDNQGKYSFRSKKGGVLNFWPSKGTLQFQGKPEPKAELEAIFSVCESNGLRPIANNSVLQKVADQKTRIFVVHGHDHAALEQLELVLRRLNLDPYILQNNDGGSKTIIEALEQQIYREASFGIVLMTPDDYGYSKIKGEEDRQPRARQNVVLEMGMVLASLGRDRMVILKKGALEIPSDIDGVLRLEFNDHVKEVGVRLATRMKNAGIEIDDTLIHRVGM